ncbi:MAG: sulfatase [Verrucomicrobiae bacterium]|nr:sulfatase [Verrucomicrobiae bacterium]NNJ42354.1 sulfatase [Akkermansiaceae bacterium]
MNVLPEHLLIWFLFLWITAASLPADTRPNTDTRPNIVFLLADDQCTYSLGCYGNKDVKTPQMDRLGRDGIIFDKHYNTTAICMASRASIMTGMYEYKTGTNFSHGNMKAGIWKKAYPVLLRESGYLTAFAGKFGFVVEGHGLCEKDFDAWGGGPGQTHYQTIKNKSMVRYAEAYPHSTRAYGAFGQDVIKRAAKDGRPFCLSISFKAPHRPVTPDPQFDHVYMGRTFAKPANYGRKFAGHLTAQSKQGRQYKRFNEWQYDTDYGGVMAKYHQQIFAIDVSVGMIRDELDRQGLAGNTVIIYSSDNGFLCGSHGYGSKVLPLEESSRVPLMIFDPRSKTSGKRLRSQALTGNIDFAPTLLELAGLAVPENMDGKSLLPILSNPAANVRERMVLINVWGEKATHCLTTLTQRLKYTYWWYGGDGMTPVEELFDTLNDPLELKNRVKDPEYNTMLKRMRQNYDAELEEWKKQAVTYNDYQRYGTLFDRNTPWSEKERMLDAPKQTRKK